MTTVTKAAAAANLAKPRDRPAAIIIYLSLSLSGLYLYILESCLFKYLR